MPFYLKKVNILTFSKKQSIVFFSEKPNINNVIIILVINRTSVHVFLKECKKSQYFGFSEKNQNIVFFQIKSQKFDFKSKYWPFCTVLLIKLYLNGAKYGYIFVRRAHCFPLTVMMGLSDILVLIVPNGRFLFWGGDSQSENGGLLL